MIFPTSLGMSYRGSIPIPVARVFFRSFNLDDFIRHMVVTRNWRILRKDPLLVQIGKYTLRTNPHHFVCVFSEWLPWNKWYLPAFNPQGITVLDVGAGSGETALFYFMKGARKVICVEPQSILVEDLKENARTNHWTMEIIQKPFELSMLELDFDFMKMDGEGCETELLRASAIPPCAIEVHTREALEGLKSRFPLQVLPQKSTWIARTSGSNRGALVAKAEL